MNELSTQAELHLREAMRTNPSPEVKKRAIQDAFDLKPLTPEQLAESERLSPWIQLHRIITRPFKRIRRRTTRSFAPTVR